MSRIPQPVGKRGSLKWLQHCINDAPHLLDPAILQATGAGAVTWRSPLRADDFAEYRDAAFLARIDQSHLAEPLAQFWPRRRSNRRM